MADDFLHHWALFYNKNSISPGIIRDRKNKKFLILASDGNQYSINKERVFWHSEGPDNSSVEQARVFLEKVVARSSEIDVEAIWELFLDLYEDNIKNWSLEAIVSEYFGKSDLETVMALGVSLVSDQTRFKLKSGKVHFTSRENFAIEQKRLEKERQKQERLRDFCDAIKSGNREKIFSEYKLDYLNLIEFICGVEDKVPKEICESLGLKATTDSLYTGLLDFDIISETECIDLAAFRIKHLKDEDYEIVERVFDPNAPLFEGLTVDGPTTKDFDDGFSFGPLDSKTQIFDKGENVLGIHITNLASLFINNPQIEEDARKRISSVYLPDETFNMLPHSISQGKYSLKEGEVRETLSVIVDPKRPLERFEVLTAKFKILKNHTYDEVDDILSESSNDVISSVWAVSEIIEKHRNENGAINFKDIELRFKADSSGEQIPYIVDLNSRSFRLVKELMILANHLFARFLEDNNIPAVFRTQRSPKKELSFHESHSPIKRRNMTLSNQEPTHVTYKAGWHNSLALSAYIQATSPLRRYQDYLCQYQILSVLFPEIRALSQSELLNRSSEVSTKIDIYRRLERSRDQFWLSRWLDKNRETWRSEGEVVDYRNGKIIVWTTGLARFIPIKHFSGKPRIGQKGIVKVKGLRGVFRKEAFYEFITDKVS